MNTGS